MTRPTSRSKPKAGPETAVVAAAYRLLASRRWRDVPIASVARAAKVPLADVLALAPSRCDLAALLLRESSREAVRRHRVESGRQNTQERLFAAVMTWFDVLEPRKKALGNLVRDLAKEPLTLLRLRGELLRISETLMAAAEADAGRSSSLWAGGLAVVIARAIPVWLDDGRELDRTMAQVDRDLRRLERLLRSAAESEPGLHRQS